MTGIAWPSVLKPQDFGYYPINPDVSGGVAPDGSEQVVASPGPRWGASMTLPVTNKDKVLAVRALRTQLKGRAIPVQLPNFDGKRLSWPQQTFNGNLTGVILKPSITRNPQLDGSIYEDPEIPDESEIVAIVDDPAAVRATTIHVGVSQGGSILAGQQFGIGERLYEIATASGFGPGDPVAHWTLTFQPPLRAALAGGESVLFTRPYCLMRCLNLNDEMRKLEGLRFATLNLEFSEYI